MKLADIQDPSQLRGLSQQQLSELAAEIRSEIINRVSTNGGHLASNLGVVELTLALHLSFRSPEDKIIWDVGHQCYTHKLLTGRLPEFGTLRCKGGLSGYPKRKESPHDILETGHSATSISAALGMAMVRDLNHEHNEVVAVIGDGALTGGMAFEALNHGGHSETHMIVVLNDNEMSIAKNVGGLSRYLNHLRTAPTYIRTKRTVEAALDRLPGIGTSLARRVERFKNSVKYFLVPGMMFEELGWTYLGPVNGHDVKAMCEAFDEAKHMEGPVIVHCLTRKGKGYKPAEMNPEVFHSVGRFEVSTGQRLGEAKYSFTDAFSAAVLDAARRRDDVMAVTAAMPGGTGLSAMAKEFPARCFDVGIAEQHAVTFASGLALAGKRPVVALYTTFLQRAYDQLVHDVCLPDLPVVFALDRAGIVGEDGETHQGVFDISFCLPIPNLIVTAPRDGAILQSLLDEMLNAEHPAVIRYPKDAAGEPVRPDAAVARGRAQVLREGSDMAIIAVGDRVRTALAAADKLHEVGIEAAVIDPVYLKPVDLETIASVTGRVRGLVVVEDGAVSGGFGQALANRLLAEGKLPGRVRLLGVPDRFIAQGSRREVLEDLGLDANGVAAAIRDLMEADSIVRS